jgi:hypothetical protein
MRKEERENLIFVFRASRNNLVPLLVIFWYLTSFHKDETGSYEGKGRAPLLTDAHDEGGRISKGKEACTRR